MSEDDLTNYGFLRFQLAKLANIDERMKALAEERAGVEQALEDYKQFLKRRQRKANLLRKTANGQGVD